MQRPQLPEESRRITQLHGGGAGVPCHTPLSLTQQWCSFGSQESSLLMSNRLVDPTAYSTPQHPKHLKVDIFKHEFLISPFSPPSPLPDSPTLLNENSILQLYRPKMRELSLTSLFTIFHMLHPIHQQFC